jgi:hypothetical protein
MYPFQTRGDGYKAKRRYGNDGHHWKIPKLKVLEFLLRLFKDLV